MALTERQEAGSLSFSLSTILPLTMFLIPHLQFPLSLSHSSSSVYGNTCCRRFRSGVILYL